MPLFVSTRFSGMAISSSCSRWCAKRPTYAASSTKLLPRSRLIERLNTWEYGVCSLSFSPQVMANAFGGVTGNEPVGGGSTIGQGGVEQPAKVAALSVGIVFKPVSRADVSTP